MIKEWKNRANNSKSWLTSRKGRTRNRSQFPSTLTRTWFSRSTLIGSGTKKYKTKRRASFNCTNKRHSATPSASISPPMKYVPIDLVSIQRVREVAQRWRQGRKDHSKKGEIFQTAIKRFAEPLSIELLQVRHSQLQLPEPSRQLERRRGREAEEPNREVRQKVDFDREGTWKDSRQRLWQVQVDGRIGALRASEEPLEDTRVSDDAPLNIKAGIDIICGPQYLYSYADVKKEL